MQSWAGNVATASPISDLNPVWLACEASVELHSTRGKRLVSIDDQFFVKYRVTQVGPEDVIVALHIPTN